MLSNSHVSILRTNGNNRVTYRLKSILYKLKKMIKSLKLITNNTYDTITF